MLKDEFLKNNPFNGEVLKKVLRIVSLISQTEY
jgi:hypothetical protein